MDGLKKILISIPDNLLREVDLIVSSQKTNRSQFVREAMRVYLREKRRHDLNDRLKKGYEEMAHINISLSQIFFEADNDQQENYEKQLQEMK